MFLLAYICKYIVFQFSIPPPSLINTSQLIIKTRNLFGRVKVQKDTKIQGLPSFDKFVTEGLIFAAVNTFFQLNLAFIADSVPDIVDIYR